MSGLGAFASWRERIARLRRQTSEVILDATRQGSPNQALETNCRPASPLDAERDFGRAVCARTCALLRRGLGHSLPRHLGTHPSFRAICARAALHWLL